MRIAFFTNNYLPNPYGVSTSVDGFARGLRDLGHEVYIFAPHWKGDEAFADAYTFRYPSIDVPTKVPFSLALPLSPELDRVISGLEFDIIHAQHPNILGTQAKRWAHKKKIPIVFTWHSFYDSYAHYVSFIPERIASKWVIDNAAHFASTVDRVIFPTASVQTLLGDIVEHRRISVVASGVDEELFANPDPVKIRAQYDIPHDAQLLVSISRLSQEKNVLFLARSIALFLQDHPHVYFLFCGDGDLREEVEEIFRLRGLLHRVSFPGKIERCDVKHYLSASDVFVYASTSETQGTIITEAMYCGVPIVAVRSSGITDIVEDGVSGILVKEIVGDFTYALERIVFDQAFRESLSVAASARAHALFTVTTCTQKLVTVYEKVLRDFDTKSKSQ